MHIRARQGPCADDLISAGYWALRGIATADVDPRVSGRGLEKLKSAGIKVSGWLHGS